MTASPTPPPALSRKPGFFDAPVWAWFCVLGLPLAGSLAVLWGGIFIAVYSAPRAYLAIQVDPEWPQRFWPVLTRLFYTLLGSPQVVQIAFAVVLLGVWVLRYRFAIVVSAAVIWLAEALMWLQSEFLAGGSGVAQGWGSGDSSAIMYEGASRGSVVVNLAVSMALVGGALWVWRRWRAGGGATPSLWRLAPVVALMPILGFLMLSNRPPGWSLWSSDQAHFWFAGTVTADLFLADWGVMLLGMFGGAILLECFGSIRPNRLAIGGAWVAATLVAAMVFVRSPLPAHVNPTDTWPVFAAGEEVEGTGLVWRDASEWGFVTVGFHPQVSQSVSDLLASGRVAAPTMPGYAAPTPDWPALVSDPFAPAQDYTFTLRRANPDLDTGIAGLIAADILRRRPLTDSQVDDWLNLVVSLPSHIHEDLALLGNLVGSGRRARAVTLTAHIRDTLDRTVYLPEDYPTITEGEAGDNARRRRVLDAYEEMFATLPMPYGQPRSIAIRLVSVDGLPVAGVPVGIYQTLRLLRPAGDAENEGVRRAGLPGARYGLFLRTDANGEAVFADLRSVEYGSTVLAGWPYGGLGPRGVAVPLSDLPSPLPPGRTEQVWRVLPAGTVTGSPSGRLTLDPEPTGQVVWACTPGEASSRTDCPVVVDVEDASGQVPVAGVKRPLALLELGPAGRPRFVWWFVPEETEAAEDAPAPADETP